MNFLNVLIGIIWLVTAVLLISMRRKFDQPDHKLSLITKIVLGLITVVIVFISSSAIGTMFYRAHHPDYKLHEASGAAGFHIYIPSYLPAGMEQRTIFRIENSESGLVPDYSSIFWSYAMPPATSAGTDNSLIIIKETKTKDTFDFDGFLTDMQNKSTASGEFKETVFSNFPGRAYIRQMKLTTGKIVGPSVYIFTSNGILINVNSTASESETLQVIGSMR